MRGFGYRCDQCGLMDIIEGDPFMHQGPLNGPYPTNWVAVMDTAGGGPDGAAYTERQDFCSWGCVGASAFDRQRPTEAS